jgi:hypothetical protein
VCNSDNNSFAGPVSPNIIFVVNDAGNAAKACLVTFDLKMFPFHTVAKTTFGKIFSVNSISGLNNFDILPLKIGKISHITPVSMNNKSVKSHPVSPTRLEMASGEKRSDKPGGPSVQAKITR